MVKVGIAEPIFICMTRVEELRRRLKPVI